ncbi:MAG TPA: hypothetical protein VH092_16720, partial [Urbifossiella sp.]|nr:hypothetical protein [Urbifossiella sp.]
MNRFAPLARGVRRAAWALAVTTSVGAATAQQLPALAPSPAPQTPVDEALTLPGGAPGFLPGAALPDVPGALPGGAAAPAPAAAPSGPRWQTPLPKPGYFVVGPTGPGYYSMLDEIRGTYREAPPKYPYPRICPIFISNADVNWTYLNNPNNTE